MQGGTGLRDSHGDAEAGHSVPRAVWSNPATSRGKLDIIHPAQPMPCNNPSAQLIPLQQPVSLSLPLPGASRFCGTVAPYPGGHPQPWTGSGVPAPSG